MTSKDWNYLVLGWTCYLLSFVWTYYGLVRL